MSELRKSALVLATLFCLVISADGQPQIELSFSSKKLDSSFYELSIKGPLPDGWNLYGSNPAVEGLSPVFNFDYENVVALDGTVFDSESHIVSDPIFDDQKLSMLTGNLSITQKLRIDGTIPRSLKGSLVMTVSNAKEFYPIEIPFDVTLEGGLFAHSDVVTLKRASIDIENALSDCGKQVEQESSLWGIFLLGFAGGLVALLTPCVFPMIPFTVSFFTRSSANRKSAIRNGITYGLFIFLIYVLLSVPFHIAGNVNPEIFNTISTNAVINVLFFGVFMFFALSFFGLFEITLPGSLTNKTDQKSGLSNIGGIFFMSLTLALVSFSCTGPILGSLLVGSLGGGVWPLTAGLAGFGAALGLPFGVFAVFPDLLKSLPRSGGWLDTVKKVLAFVEVALAFKFLSNADLVMHWGILKREVFIGIWLLLSLGLTAYLLGLIRFPHDTIGQKIGIGRKSLAVVTLAFSIYLVPGLTPWKVINMDMLSGFPPPMSYSIYDKDQKENNVLEANVINDYDRAIYLSDSLRKPLLIDFTGWACVNCRKMEENVWNQQEVYEYIRQNYILVSLYVDDRKKLPIEERVSYVTADNQSKDLVTLGDKWTTFEAENFGQVSQPFYVILNNAEQLVNNPVGYTPEVKDYLEWLECGKKAFDSNQLSMRHDN
jgi:cytochrome c biogenesis protein CcdA/thioredoxin-related protein